MIFALDTNTLVYFFKGIGRVKERLLATSPATVAIPSVVLYELELGIAQSNQPSKLDFIHSKPKKESQKALLLG